MTTNYLQATKPLKDGNLHSPYRVGIDIGGTFTDLVLLDEQTGKLSLVKMSSTPRDPSVAFMDVLDRCLKESGVDPEMCAYLVHGTTVATNTIIEGRGAKTALLVTNGFRDIFEIARQIRPRLYDLFCDKPHPLVPRRLCFEVSERLDALGDVVQPLDIQAVRELVPVLRDAQVESVVICLLHSYANPDHERLVAELLRRELPGLFLTLSSEICPEMREYFRASTAAINATVMPVICRYVEQLQRGVEQRRITCDINLMTSSGGIISSPVARREPVHLIESGPAAGVTAAAYYGHMAGFNQVMSFDMGGTTAKLGLVENGQPRIAPHFEVGTEAVASDRGAGYPVRPRWWTWWKSALEAGVSPGLTPVERCVWGHAAGGQTRARPATIWGSKSRPSRMPISFWDASIRLTLLVESDNYASTLPNKPWDDWHRDWGWSYSKPRWALLLLLELIWWVPRKRYRCSEGLIRVNLLWSLLVVRGRCTRTHWRASWVWRGFLSPKVPVSLRHWVCLWAISSTIICRAF